MEMMQRPKRGEDEEDILRMQEEFLASKSRNGTYASAAKVVNLQCKPCPSKRTGDSHSRKPSKFAQSRSLQGAEKRAKTERSFKPVLGEINEKYTSNSTDNLQNSVALPDFDDDKVYYPKVIPAIIGKIVEKNMNMTKFEIDCEVAPSTGFPAIPKCDLLTKSNSRSLYSVLMENQKIENQQKMESMDLDYVKSCDTSSEKYYNVPSKSYIVLSEDADAIHKENVKIISEMSEKDILIEQQKLLKDLDPKVIAFLKSIRSSNLEEQKNDQLSKPLNVTEMGLDNKLVNSLTMDIDDSDVQNSITEDIFWENDVLSHPDISQWLHFDSLEKDKLEWIQSIKDCKGASAEPYEARFNFKGYLLPYTLEFTEKTKPLFHHGEEPQRPGYSLNELMELTRSSVLQQRVIALNTIAGILEYHMAGTYKDVIEIPTTKIFFIIRFALDENKTIILEPALRAMRNLLYNRVDEACWDALLGTEEGFKQPYLEHDKSEIEELESKESELKDFHLADVDLIAGALRTDILQRISYIVRNIKPTFNSIQYCLQILTRLARDSKSTALSIVENGELMKCLIREFVPKTGVNFSFNSQIAYKGKPILAALKFFRVLSSQSWDINKLLVDNYVLLVPITEYISSGVDGTYGLRIQMESYCILTNMLYFNIGILETKALSPILITSLYKHVVGTDLHLDCSVASVTHVATLLQLMAKLLDICYSENLEIIKVQIYQLLEQGLLKWFSQISMSDKYTSGHLRVLCSVLNCAQRILQKEPEKLIGHTDSFRTLAASKGFKYLITQTENSSNLLSNIVSKDIFSLPNLVTLNTSIIDSSHKVLPVFKFESPIFFLKALLKFLHALGNTDLSMTFIDQMWNYLFRISSCTPSLCDNWFTRFESDLIIHILKIITDNDGISETRKDILYSLANKMCYVLRIDNTDALEFLFDKIVFNKKWFTAQRLMNLMSVTESDTFTKTLHSISEIKCCYSNVANLSLNSSNCITSVFRWREPILPRDWIYLPIIHLYTQSQNINLKDSTITTDSISKETIICCSLEWIIFNELCFADLLNDIDVTDRFCRILCVFLCDNSLFLDKTVNILLRKCSEILFKLEKMNGFNFDKDLTGINNFQDFYTQLLEQFQAVSYGDHVFAACVLVPLAQKHNDKWRKLVWSEYAGCLRALDCPEEYLCYNINDYLYPVETDESLLSSYKRALSSNLLREGTISHRIAVHHVTHSTLTPV